jgi:hypothetical protein
VPVGGKKLYARGCSSQELDAGRGGFMGIHDKRKSAVSLKEGGGGPRGKKCCGGPGGRIDRKQKVFEAFL